MGDLSLSNEICVCDIGLLPLQVEIKELLCIWFLSRGVPDAGYHEDDNENEDREFQ